MMRGNRFFWSLAWVCFLGACSKAPVLPDGVSLRVAESNDVILTLEKDRAMMVKQAGEGGRIVLVGNLDGVLSVTQLERGGDTPVSVELLGADKAKVTIARDEGKYIVWDEDGDGIPEMKMDKTGSYRLKGIEWEKIEKNGKGKEETSRPLRSSRKDAKTQRKRGRVTGLNSFSPSLRVAMDFLRW